MGTLERTWSLYKQSFNILSADAEIVLFPVMSAVSAILLAAGFFYPLFRSGLFKGLDPENPRWEIYAILFIWYFLNYFIIVFFNSALVGCANMRLAGGDPKVRDGLRIAFQRIDRILVWAFVAATVGMVLDAIRNKSGKLIGRLVAGGLGLAWTLVTYLIVPVIILENRTMYDSIQRSSELFRKRWGEQIAGSFGFGLLNFLLLIPALMIGLVLYKVDPALAVIFGIWYVIILAAITSAVRGVFTVVLYRYASAGVLPEGYSAREIDSTFGERKRDPWDITV
jgi:hypothetical protein